MTVIKYSKGKNYKLEISGHCNFSNEGSDIVCSAVSALSVTLCQRLSDLPENIFKKSLQIQVEDGYLKIKVSPKSEYYKQIDYYFDIIIYGLKLISLSYPDNVKFI